MEEINQFFTAAKRGLKKWTFLMSWPLRQGDRVSVKKLSMADDLYSVIVKVWRGRKKYLFPLVDLEVVDKDSPNYQPVNDYRMWFANR